MSFSARSSLAVHSSTSFSRRSCNEEGSGKGSLGRQVEAIMYGNVTHTAWLCTAQPCYLSTTAVQKGESRLGESVGTTSVVLSSTDSLGATAVSGVKAGWEGELTVQSVHVINLQNVVAVTHGQEPVKQNASRMRYQIREFKVETPLDLVSCAPFLPC